VTDDQFVREVQRRLGVTADGVAGPRTMAALDRVLPVSRADTSGGETQPFATPTGWDRRSIANLMGVHPDLVRVMSLARERSPIPFTVIEGPRSAERQRQLVQQGASKTMNSRHLTGHAVDIVPHRPDGTLAFDWPLYHKVAPVVKDAARELGVAIVWGGDWKSFKDGPHFELSRSAYPA
jgi:peptidoglycan LD-endopeptidase CwlK